MSTAVVVNGSRTQSIGTKVTPEDERRIKEFCEARDSDVSTMTRDLWLEKLGADSASREFVLMAYLIELCEGIYAAQCEGDDTEIVANFRDWFKGNSRQLVVARLAQAEAK